VEPDTVQIDVVPELNATAKPDVLVADTVNGAAPKVGVGNVPKLIDCDAGATVNDVVTCDAAL
jgi:hypothetical protein